MPDVALAPNHNTLPLHEQQYQQNCHQQRHPKEDPFTSPSSTCSDPFAASQHSHNPPKPCLSKDAIIPPTSRDAVAAWQANNRSSSDRMRSDAWPRQEGQYQTQKSSSMSSSGGGSSVNDGISSIDLEKGSLAKEQDHMRSSKGSRHSKHTHHSGGHQSRHSRQSRHLNRDPEKEVYYQQRQDSHHTPAPDAVSESYSQNDDDDTEVKEGLRLQEEKAVHILCFLAAPCVGLSLLNALWTLIALIITALSQPVRLCARRPSFSQQLGGLLGPALNLQLRCVYTPLPPHADDDSTYHPSTLVVTHLFSPFLGMAMAVAAWVVAVYWLLAAVVGDPVGDDKRDDGKEAVLGLRGWWESWFVRCLRHDG
ncbi:hypothetical protein MBLNU230_g2886t1 [Neophaeotheca triangularis]